MAVEIDSQKVEALAAQGLTMKQIALSLGIARSTLYENGKKNPDISDAIKKGRAKGLATISNALFQAAEGGNITAQIFYLKNRCPDKWKDRRDTRVSGDPDNPIPVSIPIEFVKPSVSDKA